MPPLSCVVCSYPASPRRRGLVLGASMPGGACCSAETASPTDVIHSFGGRRAPARRHAISAKSHAPVPDLSRSESAESADLHFVPPLRVSSGVVLDKSANAPTTASLSDGPSGHGVFVPSRVRAASSAVLLLAGCGGGGDDSLTVIAVVALLLWGAGVLAFREKGRVGRGTIRYLALLALLALAGAVVFACQSPLHFLATLLACIALVPVFLWLRRMVERDRGIEQRRAEEIHAGITRKLAAEAYDVSMRTARRTKDEAEQKRRAELERAIRQEAERIARAYRMSVPDVLAYLRTKTMKNVTPGGSGGR